MRSNKLNEDRLSAFLDSLTADLTSSTTVERQSKERLLARMRKRARFVNADLRPGDVYKFLSANFAKKDFKHRLSNDIVIEASHFIMRALENYTSSVLEYHIQETLDLPLLYSFWRFGPKASFGCKGKHPVEKIHELMGCTDRNEPYVKRLRASNIYLSAYDGKNSNGGTRIVFGSKLSIVPKNEDSMRTIAIEGSGSMCMQLAAGTYLENTLRSIGLDIRKQQPLNRALARRGSIDNSLATIDLSAASDHISIDLVRALLPKKWFDLLMDLRSPAIRVNEQWVTLNMMSTMGNGFTFPLMTLIIVSLIYAFRRISGGPNHFIDWTTTAVFGDDIIIPSREYDGFVTILQDAGLIVNLDKSYSNGPFRESCGGDYYLGVDITPFYVKSLATDDEIYVVINQLTHWAGARELFPMRSLRVLYSYLRRGPYFVPFWMPPTSGIHSVQVRRRYKYLKPISSAKPYEGFFSMMLACGSYLGDIGLGPFYLPVSSSKNKIRYSTKEARLPEGYLDGSDAVSTVSEITQSNISLMLSLV